MSQSQRDQEAEAVAKSAVVRLFGEDAIDRIDVFPTEDQAGEQGLSLTIFLKTAGEVVSGARLADTLVAISEALRDIDDHRFPYVTFLAPGYEHAEDDWRRSA
ncbi:MAG TPA: hypothetical protein VEH77_07805 [Roseiarcus sp.]|nr:hypothetical protein [Roseiarcus sp.]